MRTFYEAGTGDLMREQILLLGNGAIAAGITTSLLSRKIPVTLAIHNHDAGMLPKPLAEHPDARLLDIRTDTRVRHCTGTSGHFRIVLDQNNIQSLLDCSCIVIAEKAVLTSCISRYGLKPSSQVHALSSFFQNDETVSGHLSSPKTVAILLGLAVESHPHMAQTAMETALKLRTEHGMGMDICIFTRNLKVAAFGLETLYRKARDAGVTFIKFSDALPTFHQQPDGTVDMSFTDDITRIPFSFHADITIVDETAAPEPYVQELSRIFGLDMDAAGFAQTENIHRLSVCTNRKGILVTGGSRGVLSEAACHDEIQETVITILSLIKGVQTMTGHKAEISLDTCIHCLTCYRLCPYHAIVLEKHPVVDSDACERCGVCAAECPRKAISIEDLTPSAISQQVRQIRTNISPVSIAPMIVAFCCNRSAVQASHQAELSGLSIPEGVFIIEVPCAGGISLEYLMAAFTGGADGVLVVTCHEGNCHSERGNIMAKKRVGELRNMLAHIGTEPERILLKTIAANMPAELIQTAQDFKRRITDIGIYNR
jgi:coenzyme F420-reducing hydrogenase delta subunit/ferredoxin